MTEWLLRRLGESGDGKKARTQELFQATKEQNHPMTLESLQTSFFHRPHLMLPTSTGRLPTSSPDADPLRTGRRADAPTPRGVVLPPRRPSNTAAPWRSGPGPGGCAARFAEPAAGRAGCEGCEVEATPAFSASAGLGIGTGQGKQCVASFSKFRSHKPMV